MLNNRTLAFIGSGAMAEAMIKGILNNGLTDPRRIIASGPRKCYPLYWMICAASSAPINSSSPSWPGRASRPSLRYCSIGPSYG